MLRQTVPNRFGAESNAGGRDWSLVLVSTRANVQFLKPQIARGARTVVMDIRVGVWTSRYFEDRTRTLIQFARQKKKDDKSINRE